MALSGLQPLFQRLRCTAGFTIIETMVAVLILAIAFTGFTSVQAVSSRAQSMGQNRGFAVEYTNQQLELARRSSVGALANSSGSTTVQGVTFSMTRTVANVTAGRRVSVQTNWTDRYGPQSITFTTIVSQVTNP